MTITYSQLQKAYDEGWQYERDRKNPGHGWRKFKTVSWYRNPRLRAAYMRGVEEIEGKYKCFGSGHLSDLLPQKQPNLERGGRSRCRCPGKCKCR
jgi:hypothetical protein